MKPTSKVARFFLGFTIVIGLTWLGASVIARHDDLLGSGNQCDGIGFGCNPAQFAETVTLVLLWGALVTAVVVAATFLPRYRLFVAGGGLFVATRGVVEGRAEVDRVMELIVKAAGPADPVRAQRSPTPADTLAAVRRAPAEPCRDEASNDMGSSKFVWEARLTGGSYASLAAGRQQVGAIDKALAGAGFKVTREGRPDSERLDATRAGPPPLKDGEGSLSTSHYVGINVYADRTTVGERLQTRVEIRTPCLQR